MRDRGRVQTCLWPKMLKTNNKQVKLTGPGCNHTVAPEVSRACNINSPAMGVANSAGHKGRRKSHVGDDASGMCAHPRRIGQMQDQLFARPRVCASLRHHAARLRGLATWMPRRRRENQRVRDGQSESLGDTRLATPRPVRAVAVRHARSVLGAAWAVES
jgi:hypothetical protein